MTKVIISGGGTGGHVFPAIAIAHALKLMAPGTEILFTGAKGRMEMEKVPAAGFSIEGLWISGLQRRLTLSNLMFPVKVVYSLAHAFRIIRKFRPDIAIGVGGYASGPTIRAAALLGIPVLIQEQNSYPGITNRLLAKKADRICVAYDGMERFFPKGKLIFTGNPIRQDYSQIEASRTEALGFFNLSPSKLTVLATGGSLGAATINSGIKSCLKAELTDKGIQFIWQTGKYYYDSISTDLSLARHEGLTILPFIDRMDLAYAASDIVISRAGAIAISELCTAGKPVILVPSPNVAEDHQTKNAAALEVKNAAILLRDAEAAEKLPGIVLELQNDPELRDRLVRNIRSLAITDAAEKIAKEALALVKKPAK